MRMPNGEKNFRCVLHLVYNDDSYNLGFISLIFLNSGLKPSDNDTDNHAMSAQSVPKAIESLISTSTKNSVTSSHAEQKNTSMESIDLKASGNLLETFSQFLKMMSNK